MRWLGVAPCVALLCATGCDWTVFSSYEENSPVLILDTPGSVGAALGRSVTGNFSAEEDGDSVRILVGNTPGGKYGAQYELGVAQSPLTGAVDTNSCPNNNGTTQCRMATQPAGMAQARTAEGLESQCFAVGVGGTLGFLEEDRGVVIRCRNQVEDTLPGPEGFEEYLEDLDLNDEHQPLFLHADRDSVPALAAGAPTQELAWVYPPGVRVPVKLVPNRPLRDRGSEFGGQVAVLRITPGQDGERLVAVAAPAVNEVWLFRLQGLTAAVPVGCLGGTQNFGRTMTSGRVDGDGLDDLVIADDTSVIAVSGAALAALEPTDSQSCGTAALLPGGLLGSFTCGSGGDVGDCDGAGFGASLAVGDVDGDGDGEVLVGAPRMQVREVSAAGAVLLYNAEGDDPHELTDTLYYVSAEPNENLGASVYAAGVEPPEAGETPSIKDTVVAGAPGNNRVVLFYCNDLLDEDNLGPRCQAAE